MEDQAGLLMVKLVLEEIFIVNSVIDNYRIGERDVYVLEMKKDFPSAWKIW